MNDDTACPSGARAPSSETEEALHRAVAELRGRTPELARRAVARYVAETPLYDAETSPPHVMRQTVHNTQRVLGQCIRAVVESPGTEPHGPWADAWHEGGIDRIREGLPVREYMRAWHLAYEVLAEALQELLDARPDALRTALARSRRAHDHLLREAVTAFEAHTRDLAVDTRDAAALAALYEGRPGLLAADTALPLHPVAVAAKFGPSGAETSPDPGARTAAQLRKVRYLKGHLARMCPGLRLADIRSDSAHLLVEGPFTDAALVADRLADAVGIDVLLAVEDADGIGDLPRAHRVAIDVLAVGSGAGLHRTAVRQRDVALQTQLSTPGPALDAIRERCAPVLDHPELATTVRMFLANDCDRRRTASSLVVHPNTVDNRLARVRDLAGLNVHEVGDLLVLAIAVAPTPDEEIPPPGAHM